MQSELITSVSKVKQLLTRATQSAANGKKVENLKPEQIAALQKNGNYCHDWKKVKVSKDFDPDRVHGCCFLGKVVLGSFTQKAELTKGVVLDSGLYKSKIMDCQIGDNVLICDVKCLAN